MGRARRRRILDQLYSLVAAAVGTLGFLTAGALGFAWLLSADAPHPYAAGVLAVLSAMALGSAHMVGRGKGA